MAQTAEIAAPTPPEAYAWGVSAGDFAAWGLGQSRPALPQRLPDASRLFVAYAVLEITRRCLHPLLSSPADRLEERFASVRPQFALVFNAMRSVVAVEMSRVSEKQRERAKKAMDEAAAAERASVAEPRFGPAAAQAFLGSAKTTLLVKEAMSRGDLDHDDAARIESLLLDWALAFAATTCHLSEGKRQGKRNAVALAFRAEDLADAAYYAAKSAGVIKPARPPDGVRSYEASEEDLLLADLAARGAGEMQRRQEAPQRRPHVAASAAGVLGLPSQTSRVGRNPYERHR